MKRQSIIIFSFIFIFLLTALSSVSVAEWEFQDSGVDVSLWDICFIDEFHGWAVGDSSTIISTTDGGETWVKQESPVKYDRFKEVFFINKDIGYCISKAVILVSNNGGNTWEILNSGIPGGEIWDISFINENNGWISSGKTIVHTSDGGNTWETQYTSQYWIWAVDFIDENRGWALGSYADTFAYTHVFHTKDGGKEWKEISTISGAKQRLNTVSENVIWIWYIGKYVSDDGGIHWTKIIPRPEYEWSGYESVQDIYPVDEKKAFILIIYLDINVVNLIYTADRGGTFNKLLEVSTDSFKGYSMSAVGENQVWISGIEGKIIKYTNQSTYVTENNASEPHLIELKQNTPNPFNPSTTIQFELSERSDVELTVYDVAGQKVAVLIEDTVLNAGIHDVVFDAAGLASGMYF